LDIIQSVEEKNGVVTGKIEFYYNKNRVKYNRFRVKYNNGGVYEIWLLQYISSSIVIEYSFSVEHLNIKRNFYNSSNTIKTGLKI